MFRVLVISGLAVFPIAGFAVLAAFRASQTVPDFYQEALVVPADVRQSADDLEREVLDVHNDIQDQGLWQASFTEQQINAWLATHLIQQFPGLLPDAMHDPRISIKDGKAQIACQYEGEQFTTILSLAAKAYLTEEPNVFAIEIESARAGLLPVPLKKVIARLSDAARRARLQLRWSQNDGSPVALVNLPIEKDQVRDDVLLESLELRPGELFVAGSVKLLPDDSERKETLERAAMATSPVRR